MLIFNNKASIFAVIDFNFSCRPSGNIPPKPFRGESAHERGIHRFRRVAVPSAPPHVSESRRAVPRSVSRPHVLLLGSVRGDGLRATHRAGFLAQHRIVSFLPPGETLSRRPAGKDLPFHLGRREREAGLSDLPGRRVCPDPNRPQVVPGRGTGGRTGTFSLRLRLHHRRLVSFDLCQATFESVPICDIKSVPPVLVDNCPMTPLNVTARTAPTPLNRPPAAQRQE